MGHGLHAASDDHILGAAHHRLGGKVHRLQKRTALAIDGGAGYRLRQAGSQPTGAGNVPGQRTDGVDTAEDHVVVIVIVIVIGDVVALDQRTQDVGARSAA